MSQALRPIHATSGTRVGPYALLMDLASGGMAKVYLATRAGAAGFARLVVVKRVHRHLLRSREFYDMFREEARVASTIHHPNVVPVIDVLEARGELFLVLEYVDSAALSTLLRNLSVHRGLLAPAVVSRIVLDALAGLGAAHDATDLHGEPMRIVHRDVSPQNVIVGLDGVARLIDFGIAKAEHRLCATRAGQLKGKSSFMSPEQARGEPLDRRSDLFSLGIVLHEALTTQRLFAAAQRLESMRRVLGAAVPPPSAWRADVSPELDAVVARALERDRSKRYGSAREFTEALEAACPPAPHREVARVVERLAGQALKTRREALRQLLRASRLDASRPSAAPPALPDAALPFAETASGPAAAIDARPVTDASRPATEPLPPSMPAPDDGAARAMVDLRTLLVAAAIAAPALIAVAALLVLLASKGLLGHTDAGAASGPLLAEGAAEETAWAARSRAAEDEARGAEATGDPASASPTPREDTSLRADPPAPRVPPREAGEPIAGGAPTVHDDEVALRRRALPAPKPPLRAAKSRPPYALDIRHTR